MNEAQAGCSIVHENQRWWYGKWGPPARLERPSWSDPSGRPTPLAETLLQAAAGERWQVVADASTDAQGWQYGTLFSHLDSKRPGGRASRRLEDFVRRRVWKPPPQPPAAEQLSAVAAMASSGSAGPDAIAAGSAAVAATARAAQLWAAGAGGPPAAPSAPGSTSLSQGGHGLDVHQRARELMRAMHLSLLQRRRLWSILPWGPPAIGELRRAHSRIYQELQDAATVQQLFRSGGAPAPRSPLRPATRTLQQDLLLAALHSRAAYGFAAARGHMDSVRSYIRLRTVERLRFDPVGGVSAEANNEAVGELTGVSPDDILASCWRSAPLQPSYYVAMDRANACLVVAIRGSLEEGDWLSDLCARPTLAQLGGLHGWAHAGILESARHVLGATRNALEEAARRAPGWPLLVTGHSLGGGVAALLTLLLVHQGLPQGLSLLHCVALGPAAVLSAELSEASEGLVTSVVVGSDIVPQLSCASVEALMLEMSATSPGRQAVAALNQRLAQALGIRPQDALKAEDFESWGALRRAGGRVALAAVDAGLGLNGLLRNYQDWLGQGPANPSKPELAAAEALQLAEWSTAPPGIGNKAEELPVGRARAPALYPGQPGSQGLESVGAGRAGAAMEDAVEEDVVGEGEEGEGQSSESASLSDDELAMLAELAVADVAASELAEGGQAAATRAPGSEGAQEANALEHPQHLYPPGRIIWVFPPDESLEGSLAATTGEAAGCVALGIAAAAGPGQPTTQPGGAFGAAIKAASEGSAAGQGGSSSVPEGQAAGVRLAGQAPAGGRGPAPQLTNAVAALADRRSFERVLLLPDMLSDHLPVRYLAALKCLA